MLYLKSLTLHRFKSFKHAELLFSKGFTCVVGPNGSGKSNICDALLFGLGEGSLRRLRARGLDSLITSSGSRAKDLRKAYVNLELDGDEPMSVTRWVRSDGKSLYKVNGKRMTRNELQDLMGRHGIHADETNTITQGEINKFNDLSPRGRRELIDIASGIEEFERKKDESLKELEKVGQRISEGQILLDERTHFLKELEAEKAAAEKYVQMGSRLKQLNYSIILTKKQDAEAMLSEYTKALAITDAKKNELANRLEELSKKSDKLNADRQQLTKDLGDSAKTMGEINARLEAVRMEMAKLDLSTNNHLSLISEAQATVAALSQEESTAKEQMARNEEELTSIASKLKALEPELSKSKIKAGDKPVEAEDMDRLAADEKKAELSLEEASGKISSFKAEISGLTSGKDALAKEAKKVEGLLSGCNASRADIAGKRKESEEKAASIGTAINATESELDSLNKKVSNADEHIIELKSQRATTQSRGSAVYDKIKERFGKEKGFHGRASDLCTYDAKDGAAVEAAAGARLDYIIVDSISTADTVIKYLRANGLGRATFIPMKELRPGNDPVREKEATPVADLVSFEDKYAAAFGFIFGNTFVVENPEKAKKIGIGRHRYVTPEGDLIEQSGVLSGGSVQRRSSAAVLDRQIRELTDGSAAMKREIAAKTELVFRQRKEFAYAEAEAKSYSKELSASEAEARKLEGEKKSLIAEIESYTKKSEALEKALSASEAAQKEAQERLDAARQRLSDAYSRTMELSKQLAKYGMSKEDLQRIESMRKEAEDLRIRKAELQKENQMLEQKAADLRKQASARKKSESESKAAIKENHAKQKELESSKKEIETRITSDNDTSKRIYGKINALDVELAKVATESSKAGNEHSALDRQLGELRMKRDQAETRINDFAAELSAYREKVAQLEGNVAEMEKEAIVLNAKISDLGNVNLKAPEMFEEKKKNADEALTKVQTLENERQAVLRMISEIDSKKLQTFMSTLNDIAKNFSKLFNYIFPGSASIRLENPKDPFNSGLEIVVTNDKSAKVLSSMSGGEKSLLSLILIFSIHMCKPSSLYIFDEVDAALDKENSKKLSLLIKEMSKNAQFVVVSHNDSLISNADTAVGVAKNNDESRAVGIEISSMLSRKQ